MREADDATVRQASIFVDTTRGAVLAGELTQSIADGLTAEGDIGAELADPVQGWHPGRAGEHEITLFRSVGDALQDLAAALVVVGQHPTG